MVALGVAGQKGEVGTDGRGWHAANPQILCRPPLFGTAAAGNEGLVQTDVVGRLRPWSHWVLRARKGRLVQADVVGAPLTPRFCADPHLLALHQPEMRGWYRRRWLAGLRPWSHRALRARRGRLLQADVVGTPLTPRFCADPHFLARGSHPWRAHTMRLGPPLDTCPEDRST